MSSSPATALPGPPPRWKPPRQVPTSLSSSAPAAGAGLNGRGQRYVAEDMYSGRIGQLTLYQQDDAAFLIIDGDAQEEAMAATSATPFLKRPATWVCETVAELEGKMGFPTGSLQSTVRAYNQAAARGEDPLLHKKSGWVKPIGSPIGAIDLRASCAGFTLGGLLTTLDAEVLHVSGEPIPGLFAVGRTTSGLAAWGYTSESPSATAASTVAAPDGRQPRVESLNDLGRRNRRHRCQIRRRTNIVRRKFIGKAAHQADDPMFGCGVVRDTHQNQV
jgi:hypothetical protein